ncbi:MAG: type II toxin-antitoxin system VapC family toxin [Magnetococcales bacterium]|nr:type II toxin-antitoxin system VapC family toxin [Magnetococcales bacterium]
MSVVLDASALLAYLHGEPGAEEVDSQLDGALISSVNWSEVLQKSMVYGVDIVGLQEELTELGLQVVPFDHEDASRTAWLWHITKSRGLSFADRVCLALGVKTGRLVLTADRVWKQCITPELPEIFLIR